MMFAVGLYHARSFSAFADVLVRLSVAVMLSVPIFSVIFYVWPAVIIWRGVLAFAVLATFFSIAAVRFCLRNVIDLNLLRRRVLVLGVGERASRVEALERDGVAFGFNCLGYFDVAKEPIRIDQSRIISGEVELEDIVREARVDEIVVAVDDRRNHLPMQTLMGCRTRGINVIDYLTFYERETGSVDLAALQLGWFLFSPGFPNGHLHRILKRGVDIGLSLFFLVLFLPLMVLTACAIRLEGPGPILLRQTRVGTNGRPFVLLKFRSMSVDAENDGRPRWAAANDPRITIVGAFIRKFRIDEMPQIFNVLIGDMSFVGPRPERPFFVNQLAEEIPFYGERHRVKPGITGWAQLNYSYGASIEDAARKHQYDLYYVRYTNILLDLVIILQTIRVVLWPQGVR
jgi:sugar transferase (PEP-CTERM system associated)